MSRSRATIAASSPMRRQSVWSSTSEGVGQRFELEPPGFVAFYRIALWCLVTGLAMVLPMSLLGIFGALIFDDFAFPLRIAMGIGGVGTAAAALWLSARVLLGAVSVRSRVTITPTGVLVETGVTSAREHVWLAPLATVTADAPKVDTLEKGGVELTAGDTSIHIAIGMRRRDQAAVLKAIQAALASVAANVQPANVQGGRSEPPPLKPLGPPWPARLRRLAADIAAPLRQPTPYLLVDLGAIIGTSTLTWVLSEWVDWRDAYPVAFGLFIVGLAARRYDGTYVGGLREYLADDHGWSIRYVLASIGIALAGAGAMTPRLGFAPALAVATVTSIGLHWAMLRRARGDATPKSNRTLDFVLALSLVPISVLHETAMFEFIVRSTRDLAAFSLTFVPIVVLVAYVPVRLHAFVDDPGNRSNVVWFWLTVIWLALGPVIATGVALVDEF